MAAQRRDDLHAQFKADLLNHSPHELIFIDETGIVVAFLQFLRVDCLLEKDLFCIKRFFHLFIICFLI